MTSKEHLSKVYTLDQKINRQINRLEILRSALYSRGGLDTEERVQSFSTGDVMAIKVAKVVDQERYIDQLIDELVDLKVQLVEEIAEIEGEKEKALLYKRYVELKYIRVIAWEMRMSISGINKLHKKALDAFSKKFGLD